MTPSASPVSNYPSFALRSQAASKDMQRFSDAVSLRRASRAATYQYITSGQAAGHVQASPVILPSRYASDFRRLCERNPVPCPLLAESAMIGSYNALKSWLKGVPDEDLARYLDLRRDTPRYMVYENGGLVKDGCTDIEAEWTEDHVAFLIGCSYSFETALTSADLPPLHVVLDRNCPMYRTTVPLCSSGVFVDATYVVSMRPYRKEHIERVREVTRPFAKTHGEPIAWGWEAVKNLGIRDINDPEWGDPPLTPDGRLLSESAADDEFVPVFWGCGTTPQDAVMKAKLQGTIMCHCSGHILVLDLTESALLSAIAAEPHN